MISPATRAALVRDLTRDEGAVPHPYKCPAGRWSAGIGRNIEDNRLTVDEIAFLGNRRAIGSSLTEQVAAIRTVPLNREEMEFLLDKDIDTAIRDANDIFGEEWHKWPGARQRAVLNMLFNLGKARFKGFRNSIALMRKGEWTKVGENILKSLWARQVGLRAERIAALFRRG